MLNMNTQKGQTIYIGDNCSLKLIDFDEENLEISVCEGDVEVVDNWKTFNVSASQGVLITNDVEVLFIGIGNNGIQYAILGFDAPRHIRIIGEWKTGNRDPGPADRAKLSQMSDASLLYYANINAKSALEHELMNRFKKNIRTYP